MQPAVFDDFSGRIGALPVAQHHLRAFHAQLARLARRDLIIVIVHQLRFGRRNRQPDTATVVVNIVWVHADQRRALRQAIALQQILTGELNPPLGHHLLHRHSAAGGKMQRREIELLKLFVVKQGVEQRIDPGHCGERVFCQLFDQPRDITRVGNQQVLAAELNEQQAVHGQRKNVVQRQRRHDKLFPTM